MKRVFLVIVFSLTVVFSNAQKREFRAAWIATVANIDWPSKPGLPAIEQQQEIISRFNQLKKMGCNAVIVQVRPTADAFYDSPFEPWSHYLTGRQGQPPFPYYDPLEFMIEQAHQLNMEFHAWFNPFRALTDASSNPNPREHVTHKHPEWIVNYDGKALLNPGIPEAREYVLKVILDVVKRYDIDAVHLDDYFYPYRAGKTVFGDDFSFRRYGGDFSNKDDWRRNNVNLFVATLSSNIKSLKPYVKFGVSPFGVWRNSNKDAEGSETRAGQTNYDDLYADVLLWLKNGWVDYCVPQLYWEHHHKAAPFEVLLPWWDLHNYGRHIYYGLGAYRMVGNPGFPWRGTNELMDELRDIRNNTRTPGYSFYSTSSFDKIKAPIVDSVTYFNRQIAFPPTMHWIDSIAPETPIVKAIPSSQGTLLTWQTNNPNNELLRFAVYRFTNDEPVNLSQSDKILTLTTRKEFLDADANKFKKCTYIITSLDRLWNESAPSLPASPGQ